MQDRPETKESRGPSRTARGAAAYRAAHQTIDKGFIFSDAFARPLLGEEACQEADQAALDPSTRIIRLFMNARSRYAEDCLADDVAAGCRQAVILGAGLDTFCLRNPHHSLRLHVYEVDHPATQAWKRERLRMLDIALSSATLVAVDFESDHLASRLLEEGVRLEEPVFFIWLGVLPYLSREAVSKVLGFVGGLPSAAIVFDYSEPLENYPPHRRAAMVALSERVKAAGEPWLTLVDPQDCAEQLRRHGLALIEDLRRHDVARRYFGKQGLIEDDGAGPHLVLARTIAR